MNTKARFDYFVRLGVRVAASTLTVLGLVVLVGWYTRAIVLIQIHPAFAPMQYNTALSFLLSGAGLLMLMSGWSRLGMACGGVVAVIGLLTLVEYILGINLGIDQLLMEHYVTVQTSHPGRMAPNTALCFFLAGTALLMLSRSVQFKVRLLVVGLLGSAIIALGAVAFFGYFNAVETAYGWGQLTRMAVHTSVGFVVLGTGVFAYAWREEDKKLVGIPLWLPIPVGATVATIAVVLWQALVAQERLQIQRTIEAEAENMSLTILDLALSRIRALDRMGKRWDQRGGTPQNEWEADATAYMTHGLGYHTIGWADTAATVRWVVPLQGNEATLGLNLTFEERRHEALEIARNQDRIVVSPVVDLVEGRKGFLVYVPLFPEDSFDGFILGTFRFDKLLASILEKRVALGYQVVILYNDEEIFSQYDPNRPREAEWWQEVEATFYGNTWRIRIRPGSDLLDQMQTSLPRNALAVGIGIAFLVALVVRMAQASQFRAKEIEQINRKLEIKIAEHRQAQETLRRTYHALNSSLSGIILTDLDGTITFANPAFLAMFEYENVQAVLGKKTTGLFATQTVDTLADLTRLLNQSDSETLEFPAQRRDGSIFPVEVTASVIYNLTGTVTGRMASFLDITERKKTEEALQRQAAELKRSNQELERFAYVASHDLQEPLRKVKSFTELLARHFQGQLDERVNTYIAYVIDGAERMHLLINDLLAYSRVERRELSHEAVDLSAIVQQVWDDLELKIRENEATITYDALPTIKGHKPFLQQLFQNLISNAIKFRSEAPPHIHIAAKHQANEWVFSVEDNGIGIEPQFYERIFVIFQRLHLRSEYAGTGIGLAVCKKIVERHGGKIWVTSEPGQGTTFSFTLPGN